MSGCKGTSKAEAGNSGKEYSLAVKFLFSSIGEQAQEQMNKCALE